MTQDPRDTKTVLQKKIHESVEQMETMFAEAFGIRLEEGLPEVEDAYEKKFGVRPNGNIMALLGTVARSMQSHVAGTAPTASPEAAAMDIACIEAAEIFLRKARPRSVTNEPILDGIAEGMTNLQMAQASLDDDLIFEAVHFLLEAKFSLGASHGLIVQRQDRRQIASQGAKGRGNTYDKRRNKALTYIRDHISPKISAENGASRMIRMNEFNLSHAQISKLIREYRLEQKNQHG